MNEKLELLGKAIKDRVDEADDIYGSYNAEMRNAHIKGYRKGLTILADLADLLIINEDEL